MQTHPLEKAQHLDPLLDAVGDRRIVMLGEASHGTSEYYNWRKLISKRLIEEKGFHFIAVEGDWPDCHEVNRYVKGQDEAEKSPDEALEAFRRWPTWMWSNWEVAALVKWMKEYNQGRPAGQKAGFYGLDVYSLYESLEAVVRYLRKHDGSAIDAALEAFRCFEPFYQDPQGYAAATRRLIPANCEREVVDMLGELQERRRSDGDDREAAFNNEQNARVAVNAEKYYRAMMRGGGASWNVRDRHMMDTLNRLLDFHGPESKAIVWAHNTHIGDARATDMGHAGLVNIGQLAREEFGEEEVFLAGFGSHRGTVIAGEYWGAPMKEMKLPPAREDSWEAHLYEKSDGNCLLFSEEIAPTKRLRRPMGHRAVGVVYDPARETRGNYVPSILPERYDAFLYFEETEALHPLALFPETHKVPQTFPWQV